MSYKGASSSVREVDPCVTLDVTDCDNYRLLSNATQVSRHTLFGTTGERMEAEAQRTEEAHRPAVETPQMSEQFRLNDVPRREG